MREHEAIGDALGGEGVLAQGSEERAELEMELDRLLGGEAAEAVGAVHVSGQVPPASGARADPSTGGPRSVSTADGDGAARRQRAAVMDSSREEHAKVLVPLPS